LRAHFLLFLIKGEAGGETAVWFGKRIIHLPRPYLPLFTFYFLQLLQT
jgi:hypothetical protein